MIKKAGIYLSSHKNVSVSKILKFINKLSSLSVKCGIISSVKPPPLKKFYNKNFLKEADILFVFGGDGSVLNAYALSKKYNIPIAGINFGKLGFLTKFEYDEILREMKNLISGNYTLSQRMAGELVLKGRKYPFLNDVSVIRAPASKILNLKVSTDIGNLNFDADGIIISTPTGATGYNYSASGAVVDPSLNVFQITPVCAHRGFKFPVIISADKKIKINIKTAEGKAYLTFDGQKTFSLEKEEDIRILKYPAPAKLIMSKKHRYFTILKNKFNL